MRAILGGLLAGLLDGDRFVCLFGGEFVVLLLSGGVNIGW